MKKWVLLLIIFCLLFLPSLGAQTTERVYSSPFPSVENKNVGQEIPQFTLNTTSGKLLSLDQFRNGKMLIMFFWATWCPHCQETLKELYLKKEEFEQKNIKLALIDVGENKKVVKKFLKKYNLDFEVFLDETSSLVEIYDLKGVPAFFLVNEKGTVNMFIYNNLPKDYELVLSYTEE